jgi:hypothetical protein
MKKLASFLILLVFSLSSCEGPSGPVGPQGAQGTYVVGQTYEYTRNFTSAGNFETAITFPKAILPSDVVLVYKLWTVDNGVDVWRPVPQSVTLPQGVLTYNFDFSKNDLYLFINSNFDLTTASTNYTLDQTFRIVVVPSDFAQKMSKNASYEEVTTALKIQSKDFKN